MTDVNNKDYSFNEIETLLSKFKGLRETDMLNDSIRTLMRIHQLPGRVSDLSMINTTLKELRRSTKVFGPYGDARKVCIFGSARTKPNHPQYQLAEEFAEKVTKKGFMVITGAGGGIMEAGNKGSVANMSFGVNIDLPFEQEANPFILNDPKLVNYKYFFNRKLVFVKESDATVLLPGGFGTHDEGFEILTLLQTGRCAPRPVVLLDETGSEYWSNWLTFVNRSLLESKLISEDDMNIFSIHDNSEDALNAILLFYKNYHSVRYLDRHAILRLNNPLSDDTMAAIKSQFSDIITSGDFVLHEPNSYSLDDADFPQLYRLVFPFNMVNYGRLYQLIRVINQSN